MKKLMAALAVTGPLLLGIGAASPALAQAAPGANETYRITVRR
jgi:hypothetical protein